MQLLIDGREAPSLQGPLAEALPGLRDRLRAQDRWITGVQVHGAFLVEVRTASISETVQPARDRLAELAEEGESLHVAAVVALAEAPEEAGGCVQEVMDWWAVVVECLIVLSIAEGEGALLADIADGLQAADNANSSDELAVAVERLALLLSRV